MYFLTLIPNHTHDVGKILPWRVMGKKPFCSRDRLVKHEFDCLGLGLGLGLRLWLGLWISLGLSWLGLGLVLGFI